MTGYAPSPDQVRAALEELLGWTELVRSPQLAKFLSHIVEAKLRGEAESIKAYSIAVDVFGRPTSFDPQSDPIVRVQARRLRGLLQEFERQRLGKCSTRITLPVGRYVPEFELIGPGDSGAALPAAGETALAADIALPSASAKPSRRRSWLGFWPQAVAALSLVVGIGLLLAALQLWRDPLPTAPKPNIPGEPMVYLSPVSVVWNSAADRHLASKLGDQLSAVLAQSEDVEVGFVEPGKAIPEGQHAFLLASTITPSNGATEVHFILTDVSSGEQVWTATQTRPVGQVEDVEAAALIAAKVIRDIGSYRGPLHARGRAWLDANSSNMTTVSDYVCRLAFRAARDMQASSASARLVDCVERLFRSQPDGPVALALKGWSTVQAEFGNPAADGSTSKAVQDGLAMVERAVQLAPDSAFVYEILANIQGLLGNLQAAKRNYSIAIGFQPHNPDARAGYSLVLAAMGEWNSAEENALAAIEASAVPSAWFYGIPALQAMRQQRFDDAIRYARLTAPAGPFGSVLAVAAAGLGNDQAALAEFRPEVLNAEALRRAGIMVWLKPRVTDSLLLVQLQTGLLAAGIPQSALTGPY